MFFFFGSFNNLVHYIFPLPSTEHVCGINILEKDGLMVYVACFWLTHISMIEFSLNWIWIVYESACKSVLFFLFFPRSLAFECIVSIKQSSPPRWVVINYHRKVFGGLFGLSLSSLNSFGCYLQWRCSVYAALSVKCSAMALLLPPALLHIFLPLFLALRQVGI